MDDDDRSAITISDFEMWMTNHIEDFLKKSYKEKTGKTWKDSDDSISDSISDYMTNGEGYASFYTKDVKRRLGPTLKKFVKMDWNTVIESDFTNGFHLGVVWDTSYERTDEGVVYSLVLKDLECWISEKEPTIEDDDWLWKHSYVLDYKSKFYESDDEEDEGEEDDESSSCEKCWTVLDDDKIIRSADGSPYCKECWNRTIRHRLGENNIEIE